MAVVGEGADNLPSTGTQSTGPEHSRVQRCTTATTFCSAGIGPVDLEKWRRAGAQFYQALGRVLRLEAEV
ncbi:hypothetical protein BB934_30300 (plasmid) [Microvirga ossetica]|uniref:Uncharacterized protein n=1 Tax=Microvirga ossetica TaxID=1882682 RepID=A0A1B2ERH8_9HYPH|nr:hypothetical protein BB934_30300 [Microvirga ossetica]